MKTTCLKLTIFLVLLSLSNGVRGDGAPKQKVKELKEPEDPGSDASEPTSPETTSTVPAEIITGNADCSCGRPRLGARIVGGGLAKINELPWTVAIVDKADGLVFCGATLICDKYVVTAAHCMENVEGPDAIQVYLMEQDFEVANDTARPTLIVDVEKIIIHPDWDPRAISNDITLLKLAKPVSISFDDRDSMTPACVPKNNAVSFAGEVATVAGWGATSYGTNVVSKLRKVNVPVFAQEDCKTNTRYNKILKNTMLCAGFLEGQQDSCSGDSGGPLVVQQRGQFLLIGVVSFGYGCAQPKSPGVYARVGVFADWIQQNTKDCDYCQQ